MADIFHYYAVDWMLFLCVFVHLWMLGNHLRSAFIVGMAACICGFLFGLMIESVATLVMNVVFFFMHLRAFLRWGE